MNIIGRKGWNRRELLRGLSVASGAGLLGLGLGLRTEADELPPPETRRIRLFVNPPAPVLCFSPTYIAEQFLKLEGFTDISYVPDPIRFPTAPPNLIAGDADMVAGTAPDWIKAIDRQDPVVVLGGLHVGCYELFGAAHIRTLSDLRGKRFAVAGLHGGGYNFFASLMAHIGIYPDDVEWVVSKPNNWAQMLAAGKVDAVGGFPPLTYAIHAAKAGHVILNTTTDDPWRNYFCCMMAARREYAEKNPIATKRALRAILKANELCTSQPERTARWLVEKNYARSLDDARRVMREIPYRAWRDYDLEDTVRFFSLRMHEAGLVKLTPAQVLDRGTDFRYVRELRRRLV